MTCYVSWVRQPKKGSPALALAHYLHGLPSGVDEVETLEHLVF